MTAIDNTGFFIDFTARFQGRKNPEKVVLNKITENNTEININKNCTYGVSGTTFPLENYNISGKRVQNLKWENDKSWNVECAYDWNGGQLAEVHFGWCNGSIDSKEEKFFIIDTKVRGNGIGGDSYIATLKEVK